MYPTLIRRSLERHRRVQVRHYGTVLVQFDNGRTVGVSEEDLERF
jgi:hypothetical protein